MLNTPVHWPPSKFLSLRGFIANICADCLICFSVNGNTPQVTFDLDNDE